jgi:2-dehydro-3-deoxyphosphogluconate aldolase/(4S)-4-hydroxy-2-oxoglutarate aldolase
MDVLKRLGENALIPVVVIDDVNDALKTAQALLSGGIDVIEITLRTEAALESIKIIAQSCPDILVGAGTVMDYKQAQRAVDMGAKFIVSPGFDEDLVSWCVDHDVATTPGCVTPTEIMAALKYNLNVLKFFPAGVYGGLSAMKGLSGPFPNVRFIPTGGINMENIAEFSAAPFVHTVGGSWVCARKDILENNFERITALCREAVNNALGFQFSHMGINAADKNDAQRIAAVFGDIFGFSAKEGNSSFFSGVSIEIVKGEGRGVNGHIAISTNHIERAIAFLQKKGYEMNQSTGKMKNGRLTAIYLEQEIAGFSVHLVQK